jgi:hypothetical protein
VRDGQGRAGTIYSAIFYTVLCILYYTVHYTLHCTTLGSVALQPTQYTGEHYTPHRRVIPPAEMQTLHCPEARVAREGLA